jgi:hypothetical protein
VPAGSATIRPTRGELDQSRAGEVVEFLIDEGGLNEEAARRWLSELVCLALQGGRIIGVSAARPGSVGLIAGRPFWIYQSVLSPHAEAHWDEMFNSAFDTLAREFEAGEDDYIGLCVLIDELDVMRRRREAIWTEVELMYAGYLDDGRQVRVRYFWGAAIGPGLSNSPSLDQTGRQEYPLEEGYRIVPLADSAEVNPQDVIRFWQQEGALEYPEEGAERVREVQLVAIDPHAAVAGVSSLYLERNEQLRMDLWHFRTFVGRAHRMSNIAAQLFFRNRRLMEERFVNGEDTRAAGMIFSLENKEMKAYFNKALWLPADFTFIGENELGDHVRVHYFPDATVPGPGGAVAD